MNWISVKDRLPEDEEAVLVYYRFDDESKMSFYGILTYYVDEPYPHWQHEGIGLKITHWMPLPEPPEAKNE